MGGSVKVSAGQPWCYWVAHRGFVLLSSISPASDSPYLFARIPGFMVQDSSHPNNVAD